MATLTREEFVRRFRGPMLLFLTEAWAVRLVNRKELAESLELHHVRLKELMHEMYDALQPEPHVNGKSPTPIPTRKA